LIYPFRKRVAGVNYYWLSTGRHEIHIKIDKQKTRGLLSYYSIPNNELRIILLEMNRSNSFKVLNSLVKKNINS
jgi:hypothetical protein